jgi:hypothetical protein
MMQVFKCTASYTKNVFLALAYLKDIHYIKELFNSSESPEATSGLFNQVLYEIFQSYQEFSLIVTTLNS